MSKPCDRAWGRQVLLYHFPFGDQVHLKIAMIPRCCRKTLRRLGISKKHIVEKHYDPKNAIDVSVFYPHIDLPVVFKTFKAKLRADILKGKVDYLSRRLVYHYLFHDVVGTFPIKHRWGITTHETCCVRLVCATSRCRCGRIVPTRVITSFPDGRPI